ncbi:lys-63-specific deubiquitinase BRCC36-like [Sitophilus oryzae]|uniref:Lys-63-specific deubiquitinase BRCC36-like n=1 Tax=Sitophilus oryzae TaxID=7048 RepID=A0A6J2XH15_SITOR|nr:lys-63-specific deubiquitinase BRCC36-like [Sitophilus oryzae]
MVPEKYLQKVILSSDVYAICIQHALTTEKQEIMGLLIGEIDEVKCISNISACMILHRSDKQPDRVEISPEQLCGASMHAEQLASELKRPMRVVGWYHSHPHITVWPSHVDIRTQATYQMMDSLFVGLIFSVYQNDPRVRSNQVQLTCFQAYQEPGGSELERREVPLIIENTPLHLYNLEGIANLPKILIQEEVESHSVKDSETKDPIARLHNEAFKTLALGHIVSKVSRPMCDDLVERLNATKLRIKELETIKQDLLSQRS